MTIQYLMTFHSTHDAMSVSRHLKDDGIVHAVIPTPRMLSNACGLSIQWQEPETSRIQMRLAQLEMRRRITTYRRARTDGADTFSEVSLWP